MAEPEKNEELGVSYFVGELARVQHENEEFQQYISARMTRLEQKGKTISDPTEILNTVVIVVVGLQLARVLIEMFLSWKEKESESSQ